MAGDDVTVHSGRRPARRTYLIKVAVVAWLALDYGSYFLALALGLDPGLGPVRPSAVVAHVAVLAAIVAVLWEHRRSAAVLWLAVMTGTLYGFGGSYIDLVIVVLIHSAVALEQRRWFVAVCLAQLAGAVVIDLVHGEPPVMTATLLVAVVVLASTALRALLGLAKRLRARAHQVLATAQRVRISELRHLADELEVLIVSRLESVRAIAAGAQSGVGQVEQGLESIRQVNRTLQEELRTLLSVLRQQSTPTRRPGRRSAVQHHWERMIRWPHWRRVAVTVWGVGLVVLGVGQFLEWSAGRGMSWALMLVVVVVVCVLAVLLGRGALVLTGVLVLTHAVGAVLARFDSIGLWHAVTVTQLVVGSMTVTLAVQLVRRDLRQARRELSEAEFRGAIGSVEDRRSIARELHDVVGHQLSAVGLRIMAVEGLGEDAGREALQEIEGLTTTAEADLTALLGALQSDESSLPGDAQGPLVRPVAVAHAMRQQLESGGFEADVSVDAAADDLPETQQRTITRILQEAVTNMLRHAAPGGPCTISVAVEDGWVRFVASNDLVVGRSTRHGLSHGLGLRGLRERVDLLGGTVSVRPEGGRWVLKVDLPGQASVGSAAV